MDLQQAFEPASSEVVSEEIDGEVVIVNLANGSYYSLTDSAAVIWAGIQQQKALEQIQSGLYERYSGDREEMSQALSQLIEALLTEELISKSSSGGAGEPSMENDSSSSATEKQEPFKAPVFERFTDMEDLLLLDPVHETEEEKGWPHSREG